MFTFSGTLSLPSQFGSTNVRIYISQQVFPREYLASSSCRFRARRERRRAIESARERLRRKKNRFINSIRFPLHFPSVLRLSLPLPCSLSYSVARNSSATRRARLLAPIRPIRSNLAPFRFSLSRPIPTEDIRPAIRERGI